MMWNKSKSFRYLLIFSCFLLISSSVMAQEIQEDLEDFNELKTFNGVAVKLVPGQENAIEITGHSKEKVKFEIVEDRLEIRLSLDNIWSNDNTVITVYSNGLATIDANEGSRVDIQGHLKKDDLALRVQEGAQINGQVTAQSLFVKAISGGQIELSGKAETQEVEVHTAGQYHGSGFRTKETVITAGTGGKGEIYASEHCNARAKLGATIIINGNPQQLDTKTSLGGKII
jgi:hypothetical protein